jgi:hypothetical protein
MRGPLIPPVLIGALLLGCAAFPREPLPDADPAFLAAAGSRGFDQGAVSRGHEIYASACVRCHTAIHPARLTAAEWDTTLPKMARLSRLTPGERSDIRAYIDAVRAAAPVSPPSSPSATAPTPTTP